MPVEIRELHIKVAVNSPIAEPKSLSSTTHGSMGPFETDDSEHDRLVSECVEQVLHVLQNKNER